MKQPVLLTQSLEGILKQMLKASVRATIPRSLPKCGLPLALPCKEVLMAHTEVMTMRELCVYSRCHQTTIYRPIKRKALPHFKIGSDYRFVASEIATWTRRRERRPSWNGPALRRSRSARKSGRSRPRKLPSWSSQEHPEMKDFWSAYAECTIQACVSKVAIPG